MVQNPKARRKAAQGDPSSGEGVKKFNCPAKSAFPVVQGTEKFAPLLFPYPNFFTASGEGGPVKRIDKMTRIIDFIAERRIPVGRVR